MRLVLSRTAAKRWGEQVQLLTKRQAEKPAYRSPSESV